MYTARVLETLKFKLHSLFATFAFNFIRFPPLPGKTETPITQNDPGKCQETVRCGAIDRAVQIYVTCLAIG